MNENLVKRWKNKEGKAAVEKITKIMQKGGSLSKELFPFSILENNKLDGRALPIDRIMIKKTACVNIDFSSSNFKSIWIENASFEDCQFEKVDFSDFSDHGNVFLNCIFSNCKFNKAAIGYNGTSYTNCIFNTCNFEKTIFIRAEFNSSLFKHCKLKGLDFNASSFDNCVFEGILDDVWFRGEFPLDSDTNEFGKPRRNNMKNVSFEKADLIDLTFSNKCDLSSVKLRENGRYRKYNKWDERLNLLKEKLVIWEINEQKEAEIFISSSLVHAKSQDWIIISLDDLERNHGITVATKIINEMDNW